MKVLVVADRALIREALRGVLKELRGDITVLEALVHRFRETHHIHHMGRIHIFRREF